MQEIRLPEEVLRVLPSGGALHRALQVHGLQKRGLPPAQPRGAPLGDVKLFGERGAYKASAAAITDQLASAPECTSPSASAP